MNKPKKKETPVTWEQLQRGGTNIITFAFVLSILIFANFLCYKVWMWMSSVNEIAPFGSGMTLGILLTLFNRWVIIMLYEELKEEVNKQC